MLYRYISIFLCDSHTACDTYYNKILVSQNEPTTHDMTSIVTSLKIASVIVDGDDPSYPCIYFMNWKTSHRCRKITDGMYIVNKYYSLNRESWMQYPSPIHTSYRYIHRNTTLLCNCTAYIHSFTPHPKSTPQKTLLTQAH